jgi:hypothetical protein
MKRSKFIQGLTLLSFIFFLAAFVLYRMGKFDSYLYSNNSQFQTSPNGGNIGQGPTDTVPRKAMDSVKVMMYSTKSMVLIDKKPRFLDSIKQKKRLDSINKRPRKIMMSSSKSGYIFTIPQSAFDSIKPLHILDTLKKH